MGSLETSFFLLAIMFSRLTHVAWVIFSCMLSFPYLFINKWATAVNTHVKFSPDSIFSSWVNA